MFLRYAQIYPILCHLKFKLPCSQQPATCLCPEPDESSPRIPSYFFNIYFNIILLSSLCLTSSLPPSLPPLSLSRLRTKTLLAHLLSPIRATWPADPINFALMSRKIFGALSIFPSHSDVDLFIAPMIDKETCSLELTGVYFRHFAAPRSLIALSFFHCCP